MNIYQPKAKKFTLILFFCLAFSIQPLFAQESQKTGAVYIKINQLAAKYFDLQEKNFRKLKFKLASKQLVKSGSGFKLTLEDQFRGMWIFKFKSGNSIDIYKIYKIFGLDSAQIHSVTISLNGKVYEGTIQKYLPCGKKTLCSYNYKDISPEELDYLVKAQVLDWLTQNHDGHCANFLVCNTGQNKVWRIDNDVMFLGNVVYDKDNMIVYRKNTPLDDLSLRPYKKIYQYFQGNKEIFRLPAYCAFVELVSGYPEEFLSANMKNLSSKSTFYTNKQNLLDDFSVFYGKLARAKNTRLSKPESREQKEGLIKNIIAKFEQEIKILEESAKDLEKCPDAAMPEINAVFSMEGFNLINVLYSAYYGFSSGLELEKECQKAISQIKSLEANCNDINEKSALGIYLKEAQKICSGSSPSYPIHKINMLIEDNSPVKKAADSD